MWRGNARHPERLRRLITLIEDEVGYQLYQTVSAVKAQLSREPSAWLRFDHKDFSVERERSGARSSTVWIGGDLARMGDVVDDVLLQAGLVRDDIDHVFLTGGTSFVPAVRELFAAPLWGIEAGGRRRVRLGGGGIGADRRRSNPGPISRSLIGAVRGLRVLSRVETGNLR